MNVQNHEEPSVGDSNASDDVLIKRALSGDSSAYDALVARHSGRLLTMVRGQVGNREDAEDLMQEALAQAYFKLDTFAGKSAFFTWLFRIAYNLSISRRRKKRLETTHTRTPISAAPTPQDSGPAIDKPMSDHEQFERVREIIDQLEPDRRTVLVLRDVDGMDYGDIASVLAIPKGTVRSRLHRARIELREMLAAHGITDDN